MTNSFAESQEADRVLLSSEATCAQQQACPAEVEAGEKLLQTQFKILNMKILATCQKGRFPKRPKKRSPIKKNL